MNAKNILQLATKLEGARAEHSRLQLLEPELTAQANLILTQLAALGVEHLAISVKGAENFDSATAGKIQNLEVLRTKLRLLPGVNNRLTAEIASLGAQINTSARQLIREAKSETDRRIEAERAELSVEYLKRCGGNEDRAKAAAAHFVENYSELQEWLRNWLSRSDPHDPVELARVLAAELKVFVEGKPTSCIGRGD